MHAPKPAAEGLARAPSPAPPGPHQHSFSLHARCTRATRPPAHAPSATTTATPMNTGSHLETLTINEGWKEALFQTGLRIRLMQSLDRSELVQRNEVLPQIPVRAGVGVRVEFRTRGSGVVCQARASVCSKDQSPRTRHHHARRLGEEVCVTIGCFYKAWHRRRGRVPRDASSGTPS